MGEKKYALAICRGKSVMPIDILALAPLIVEDGKDIQPFNPFMLEEIDKITSQTTLKDFIDSLLAGNFISPEEHERLLEGTDNIRIISSEDGKKRLLPEGPCFKEEKEFLDPVNIVGFIAPRITDLQLINKLYNYLSKYSKEDNHIYEKLVCLLNLVHVKIKENIENIEVAIIKLFERYVQGLGYVEKRRIGMYMARELNMMPIKNQGFSLKREGER